MPEDWELCLKLLFWNWKKLRKPKLSTTFAALKTVEQSSKLQMVAYLPEAISANTLAEMEELVQEISPDLPEHHIATNHLDKPGVMFYLFYLNGRLEGLTSCCGYWTMHPKSGKTIFANIGGITYRRSHPELKGLTRKASYAFLKHHLGPFWYLKGFIGAINTVNPKLFEQFDEFFEETYPKIGEATPDEILALAEDVFSFQAAADVNFEANLLAAPDPTYPSRSDITASFKNYYAANEKTIEQFFFDQKIFIKEEGKIFLTNRSQAVIGIHSPGKWIMRKFFRN